MKIILKTFSYAIMHMVIAIAVAYALTQNIYIALTIGLIEPVVQTLFFTIHEWIWEKDKLKMKIC